MPAAYKIGEPTRLNQKWKTLQMYVFVLNWQKKKRKLFRVSAFYYASVDSCYNLRLKSQIYEN